MLATARTIISTRSVLTAPLQAMYPKARIDSKVHHLQPAAAAPLHAVQPWTAVHILARLTSAVPRSQVIRNHLQSVEERLGAQVVEEIKVRASKPSGAPSFVTVSIGGWRPNPLP